MLEFFIGISPSLYMGVYAFKNIQYRSEPTVFGNLEYQMNNHYNLVETYLYSDIRKAKPLEE